MKNFILFLTAFFILSVISCKKSQHLNYATIKGEVLSGDVKEVTFQWIVDNPISGKGETYTAQVDSNSTFTIQIPIERIATGRISYNGYYHNIYLMQGDNIFASLNGDTIKYTGKGAEKNNLEYESEKIDLWKGAYYSDNMYSGEQSLEEFYTWISGVHKQRIDFLNNYPHYNKFEPEFIEYYLIENDVLYQDALLSYPRIYAYNHNMKPDSLNLPAEYKKLTYFSNIIDHEKTIVPDYVSNLRNQVFSKGREIMFTDTTLEWMDALHIALFDSLNGKTREYVLTKFICTDFENDMYDSVAIDKFNQIEKEELSIATFEKAREKFFQKRALKGKPLHKEFSETVLLDTSNQKITFGELMASFKGKVVYLDMWSMGCGPCRAAMPFSKQLKEKLEGQPIEFVYISLDKIEKEGWEEVFQVTFTNKNHYVFENGFNSRLNKFMEINWVPNYMIFDKEGNLIEFNASFPRPLLEDKITEPEKTLTELALK